MTKKPGTKRCLFAELMEVIDSMKARREGKIVLRTRDFHGSKGELNRVVSPGIEDWGPAVNHVTHIARGEV